MITSINSNTNIEKFDTLALFIENSKSFEEGYCKSDACFDALTPIIKQMEVLSFDVFDTLLWRDEKSELERFFDVSKLFAKKLHKASLGHSDVTPKTVLISRIYAASNGYSMSKKVDGCIEGNFDDIALNAVQLMGLNKSYAQLLKDCELEVEAAQLRISPFALRLIELATERNVKVICVSDMYLTSEQIIGLIKSCDEAVLEKIDYVYSSADIILNKRQGKIYPFLADKLDVEPKKILHVGDSQNSDYVQACLNNWHGFHLPIPKTIVEKRIASHDECLQKIFEKHFIPLPMRRPSY